MSYWHDRGERAWQRYVIDDAEDFRRHDVFAAARAREFGDLPLWLDAGDEDPFIPGQRAFADAAGVELRVSPGGHDGAYWDARWEQYLRFYARALARC